MDVRWKFWRLGQDELHHVAVGDPDPTLDAGMADGSRMCRFEWEEISGTLILLWCCTRQQRHYGQHIAGTGECVAAVQAAPREPRSRPVAAAGAGPVSPRRGVLLRCGI
jgi:hypothetical protein